VIEKLSIAVIESAVNCANQLLALDRAGQIAHAHSLARILRTMATANLAIVEIWIGKSRQQPLCRLARTSYRCSTSGRTASADAERV